MLPLDQYPLDSAQFITEVRARTRICSIISAGRGVLTGFNLKLLVSRLLEDDECIIIRDTLVSSLKHDGTPVLDVHIDTMICRDDHFMQITVWLKKR